MMRVVIDTNVLISGLYSRRGASFQILEAAVLRKLDYAISPLIALEYIGKIEDKIADGLLDLPVGHYLKIVKTLLDNGYQVLQPVLHRPTLPDNSDDKLLECAIAGQCPIILTFNKKDFPENILRRYGVKAMPPGEFIHNGGLKT